jgi:DNA-binding HxlR family transcriptional regulator
MKLEKMTKEEKVAEKRWYDDACGTALALEFLGERWSMLIVRELMLGPRRFGELKADLTGISANVLTQRLDSLEQAGVLTRRKLPPPANVQVYELTPWGYESEPIFQATGRWATRSPRHDPTLPLSPVSAMLSLRTMIDPDRPDIRMTIGFRFPGASFVGRLDRHDLAITPGNADDADVVFETDTTRFVTLVYGKWPFEESEAEGRLKLTGDRAKAQQFVDLFALPEKLTTGDA